MRNGIYIVHSLPADTKLTVFSDLDIDDGPFREAEYTKIKSTLNGGKRSMPENIPREALKNVMALYTEYSTWLNKEHQASASFRSLRSESYPIQTTTEIST